MVCVQFIFCKERLFATKHNESHATAMVHSKTYLSPRDLVNSSNLSAYKNEQERDQVQNADLSLHTT